MPAENLKITNAQLAVMLFFTAFLLRVFFLFTVEPNAFPGWAVDSSQYYTLGQSLFTNGLYSAVPDAQFLESTRLPGYSIFLYSLSELVGLKGVLLIQIILSSVLVVLVYRLATFLHLNKIYAVIAALIVAIRPVDIFLANSYLSETVFSFLCFSAVLVAFGSADKKNTFLVGILVGLGTLFRGQAVFLLPIFLILFAYRRQIKLLLPLFIGFVLTVSPWLIRNYTTFDRLFLSDAATVVTYHYTLPEVFEFAGLSTKEQAFTELRALGYNYNWANAEDINAYMIEARAKIWSVFLAEPLAFTTVVVRKFFMQIFAPGRGHIELFIGAGLFAHALAGFSFLISIFIFGSCLLGCIHYRKYLATPLILLFFVGLLIFLPNAFTAVDARFRNAAEIYFLILGIYGLSLVINGKRKVEEEAVSS